MQLRLRAATPGHTSWAPGRVPHTRRRAAPPRPSVAGELFVGRLTLASTSKCHLLVLVMSTASEGMQRCDHTSTLGGS